MDAARHSPEMEELLTLRALGALDGDDLRAVEAHLAAGCPECEAELALLLGEVEALAASLPPVPPSEMARARLFAKLPPAEVRSRRDWSAHVATLAAAAVLVLICGWGWLAARREAGALRAGRGGLTSRVAVLGGDLAAERAKNEMLARELGAAKAENERVAKDFGAARAASDLLTRDVTSTRTENERLVRDLRSARAQSERLATAMAIISAPGMKPIALAALKAPPGAEGYAFVDPAAKRAVFVAANLPPLAPDKTYELWFIADGKPVPAGTFAVDASGRSGTVTVSGVADRVQAWAVTIEPLGGVPQPTGTMVLKG